MRHWLLGIHERMAAIVMDALERSALYLVAGDMIDLVSYASARLPDYKLHDTDTPSAEGVCRFATPVRVDGRSYAALSWFHVSYADGDHGAAATWWFRPQDHEDYEAVASTRPPCYLIAYACSTSMNAGSGRTTEGVDATGANRHGVRGLIGDAMVEFRGSNDDVVAPSRTGSSKTVVQAVCDRGLTGRSTSIGCEQQTWIRVT